MMINNSMPFLSMNDFYSKMKQKQSNEVRYATYFNILFNTLLEMFDYENLPETIPKRFLESILHSEGKVFIAKIHDEIVACTGTLSGEVDNYGQGTECVAVTPKGEIQGKRDIDIVYGINNNTATPDMLIYWISHLLGESDKSLSTNIIFSRFLNIPKVTDEKSKKAFMDVFDNLIDGKPDVFLSKNVLDDIENAGTQIFQLTDVNKQDKLQYLSRLSDDILKKFYNFYGHNIQSQNKSAQSISDELHGMDSVSFILPIQMLKCRRDLCKKINKVFKTNISVNFSLAWRAEFSSFINKDMNENGIKDIIENPEEQASVDPEEQASVDPEEQASVDPEEQASVDPEELDNLIKSENVSEGGD